MESEHPKRANYLTAVRTNPVTLALAGILVLALITLLLRLPPRIQRGEEGQAAIQMLDEMRRPFLEIKQAETRPPSDFRCRKWQLVRYALRRGILLDERRTGSSSS